MAHPKRSAHAREGNKPGRAYRGSRRRVERITLRGNWSIGIVVFFVFLLMLVLAALWIAALNAPTTHHFTKTAG